MNNKQMPFLGRKWDQEGKQGLRKEDQGSRTEDPYQDTLRESSVPDSQTLDQKVQCHFQANIVNQGWKF